MRMEQIKVEAEHTFLKRKAIALASVAQLVGALSHNQSVAGSIPSWDAYLGCRFDPLYG